MLLLLSAFSSHNSYLPRKQLIVAPTKARVFGRAPQDAFFIRLFSSKKLASPEIKSDEKQSFTVSYLINSCGMSSEAAISASKKLPLNSPEKPDIVLALLKNHGFGDDHISKMVAKIPDILKADPKTNEKIVRFIKRAAGNYHFIHGVLKYTHSNVAMLRKYGVNESNMSFLVSNYPRTLIIKSDRLAKLVDRIIELGIDTTNITFVHAMQVLLSMSKSTWEHKKEAYQRCGWSDSDIRIAFSIYPVCMRLSEKKIISMMEFLVNEMSCQPSAIARYPIVLSYNLEKRIMPRCRVTKVLMLKELIKKSHSLSSFLLISDRLFLERYVTKYQEEIPLLDVYHGNVGLIDLGFN